MRALVLGLVGLTVVACGSAAPLPPAPPVTTVVPAVAPAAAASQAPLPVAVTPDEPFRQHPPATDPLAPFVPSRPLRAVLRNGIPTLAVSVPSRFVAIRIVALGGKADLTSGHFGALSLMSMAMGRGTTSRNIQALEEAWAAAGTGGPLIDFGDDAVTIELMGPASKLQEIVSLAADVALRPAFEEPVVERARAQIANARDFTASDRAEVLGFAVLRDVLFPAHPYGLLPGSRGQVLAVQRAEVVALHARLFSARRLSVSIAGGAEQEDMTAAVEAAFGGVPAGGAPVPPGRGPRPPVGAARLLVVDRPGTTPYLVGGFVGPSVSAADETAAFAAMDLVADGTVGKLSRHLRDEEGAVPWMVNTNASMHAAGLLSWQARAAVDRVAPVLTQIAAAFREMATTGPGEDELGQQRAGSEVAFMSRFLTVHGTARAHSTILIEGQPMEYVTDRGRRIAAITHDDVKRAAARWLDPARMRVVVVGDWAALREPLTTLGWGPVELRTVDGAVVREKAGSVAPR